MKIKPYFQDGNFTLYCADVKTFPFECLSGVQMIMTSPPYWALRDYGMDGQVGHEPSPEKFCETLCYIFSESKKAMNKDGTMWVNLGDSYIGSPAGNKKPSGFQQKHAEKVGKAYYAKSNAGGRELHPETAGFQRAYSQRARQRTPKQRLPNKCLAMIPARFAIMMCDKYNFTLRNDIIWHKPNPTPFSGTDRFTVSHENIYLFSMQKKYKFNQQFEEVKWYNKDKRATTGATKTKIEGKRCGAFNQKNKGMKNMRALWTIPAVGFKDAHFATYNPKLITTPILAGTDEGDVVLDPFMGSGTTAVTAVKLGRKAVGIDINEEYCELAVKRYKEETSQTEML